MAYAAYIVVAIGVGRARRTQFNWVVTGAAAVAEAPTSVAAWNEASVAWLVGAQKQLMGRTLSEARTRVEKAWNAR